MTPPENYNIIGPFVMGEREEGVDTLESYGMSNIFIKFRVELVIKFRILEFNFY